MKRKNNSKSFMPALGLMLCCVLPAAALYASDFPIEEQNWSLQYNADARGVDFVYKGDPVLSGVYVKAKVGQTYWSSADYADFSLTDEAVSDDFGDGTKYTVKYAGAEGAPDLLQVFYFYPDKDYFLTEAYVESAGDISSNYIAPVATQTRSAYLPQSESNRILSVPFDNDSWIRYSSSPLTTDTLSFEVTAVFNGEDRHGFVVGSVEHDTWKTGIRFSTKDNQAIERMECFGGITHEHTRDVNVGTSGQPKTTKEHGAIRGKSLKSPKVLVGVFDDWRRGMEAYGEANAVVAPRRTWITGTPFGWNSWGAMEKEVNFQGVREVMEFVKEELQPLSFENDGITYMVLDSYWDINFSDQHLMNFVKLCKRNDQKPGIYWTPFSDWNHDGDRYIEGTDGQYKYKDAYLYADGKVRSISGLSLDPTHPGVQKRIQDKIAQFKKWGFEYVKLDFLNNGSQEADSFYDPNVTTGMQAYNQGMQCIMDACGDDMFVSLSIAPTFPAQYAHSKRLSCDVWGAMRDTYNWTGSTEYLLNSLSFGWWLDRVYTFNDADHIVFYDEANNRKFSENENRARVTSAVITGLYMLGDNLSLTGLCPGTQTARDRVLKFATNADINEIARIGKSFYPVEGYKAEKTNGAENFFMMETDNYLYLAVFNYHSGKQLSGEMELSRMGVEADEFRGVKELWTGEEQRLQDKVVYDVPKKDVRVYRLTKKGASAVEDVKKNAQPVVRCVVDDDVLSITADDSLSGVRVFSLDGKMLLSVSLQGEQTAEMNIASLTAGTYIASSGFTDGSSAHTKFMKLM